MHYRAGSIVFGATRTTALACVQKKRLCARIKAVDPRNIATLWIFLASSSIQAVGVKAVYLDDARNVHIVTLSEKDIRATKSGNLTDVKLSPDGKTVTWLVKHGEPADNDAVLGASKLIIYRNGHTKSINCEPFIRAYWFWLKGTRIAVDCGGSHFAGTEKLYDVATLRQIDSFDQRSVAAESRPVWSESSDHFQSN
jgi:hypothetical protein